MADVGGPEGNTSVSSRRTVADDAVQDALDHLLLDRANVQVHLAHDVRNLQHAGLYATDALEQVSAVTGGSTAFAALL